MSRLIKFRAKDASGNWVVGGFFEKRQPCGRIDSIIHDGRYEHVVLKETLGQYTGINDKNGVEIYEGDILSISALLGKIVEVKYENGAFRTYPHANSLGGFFSEEIEVIGNIHEHPELLED